MERIFRPKRLPPEIRGQGFGDPTRHVGSVRNRHCTMVVQHDGVGKVLSDAGVAADVVRVEMGEDPIIECSDAQRVETIEHSAGLAGVDEDASCGILDQDRLTLSYVEGMESKRFRAGCRDNGDNRVEEHYCLQPAPPAVGTRRSIHGLPFMGYLHNGRNQLVRSLAFLRMLQLL